jgi:predicted alpha/beta-fold hydrolase
VVLDYPAEGGHVGFAVGGLPGKLDWLPQRLLHFMEGATNDARLEQHG